MGVPYCVEPKVTGRLDSQASASFHLDNRVIPDQI